MTLVACAACSRHVRTHERACPFCDAAIDLRETEAPRVIDERTTRSALHALGFAVGTATIVSVAVAAGGCITAHPLYGAPGPPIDAGNDAGSNGDGAP